MRLKQIPKAALRFHVGAFEFGDNGEGAKTAPFKMVARTGDPISHWYFGKVVHDLSGMTLNHPRITVDYCHDSSQVLGWANKFDISTGDLVASGAVQSTKPGDRAEEVIARGKQGSDNTGTPYEASIMFDQADMVCEDVDEGKMAKVNGRDVTGPATVIRKWTLRGLAVCPYGADRQTATEFDAGNGDTATVQFLDPPAALTSPDEPNTPPAISVAESAPADPAMMAASPENNTPPAVAGGEEVPVEVPAVEAAALAAVEASGAEGQIGEGKASADAIDPTPAQPAPVALAMVSQATELSADRFTALTSENEQLKTALAEANSRLQSLGALGEAKPVAFQAAPEKEDDIDAAKFAKMTKAGHNPALAAFAASLKLPRK